MVDFRKYLLRPAPGYARDLLRIARWDGAVVVAVSGSRRGATAVQLRALRVLLHAWKADVVVHGDCVGVDAQADRLAEVEGIPRGFFPSTLTETRAWTAQRGARPLAFPSPPMTRNQWIVQHADVLVAMPRPGSRGTWDAVRHASRERRPLVVLNDVGLPYDEQAIAEMIDRWY